ncbi:lysosomal acid glucosylceramidase [Tribolium castaneum]|uniref:Glucosylceramidase n=1 Tax=Tribolium castaneum TaxID=7070 RepID=D6WRN0_TRICA|nr:PREDICTED: glucosylceramidase [Tribolium castaneum]EFA07058.2 Glucosylceramidase-like Protein [Tribolium castaneum]|eukprot:XP_975608.1 PREDICTED: glucosylceramidase [Tribolium castaneum]
MLAKILLLFLLTGFSHTQECLSRDYGHGGTVCVCNATHCDTVPQPEKVEPSELLVYTSNKAGLRFHLEKKKFESSNLLDNQIIINPKEKYQTILGWGGAFTDATGINIASLEEELQSKLLESYFSENGIEYSLCRVPIGGTDFSVRAYSYDDGEEDKNLTNFKLAEEDHQYKIPYIKKALNLTGNNLKLFASAWTAPTWMKTNGEYTGFGFLKEEMFQTWANYFVKFLDEYEEQGVEFWGITTGNEPSLALVPLNQINSVGWDATEMGKWIVNNLGPTIRNSTHQNIKIMILDDQRLFLPWFVDLALKDNSTRSYIDGVAIHWYLNNIVPITVVNETHSHFPEKFILATEACNGIQLGVGPVVLGSWERGEYYSFDIIEDLLNWVSGWVDWNMVLDLTGGPTYINNNVDSPIIVNASAGEFYKQPMYYHLGHFSKFLPRHSVRIAVSNTIEENVLVVAFQRPDNATAVIILNRNEDVVPVSVTDPKRGTAQLEISEKSITTLLYW